MQLTVSLAKTSLVILVSLLLFACGSRSNADLVEFVESTYKNERPEIEPLPPVKPYEEFIYAAQNLSDPFDIRNVRVGDQSEEQVEKKENRRKEPLEAYSLDALRLDGILQFQGKVSAIIKSPDGVIPVSIGNYIGLNQGKILSINSDEQVVEIEERFKNAIGAWEKRIIRMVSNSDQNSGQKK